MGEREDDENNSNLLSIPSSLIEINTDWVGDLLYKVLKVPVPSKTQGTHNGINLLRIRAETSQPGFREVCHVTAKCASLPEKTFNFLVQIVPKDPDLKRLVAKHNLFAKEIIFFEEVLPLLKKYVQNRSKSDKNVEVVFSVPKYIYGMYDYNSGNGVVIFEDYTELGYRLADPQLMLLESGQIREVIHNLATFHAICVAFETTEEVTLEEMFPVLDGDKGCTWFQEDMSEFIKEMFSTCSNFLKSIPGKESLSELFESKMSNPEKYHQAGKTAALANKLKSVIHGDLWHNNIFFHDHQHRRVTKKLMITDWQMCHLGNPTNDLCFLLFSSTTPGFRQDKWESSLQLYYDDFVATLRSLGVTERQLSISYNEFLAAIKVSIPVSLFFCGNVQDFDTHDEAVQAREVLAEEVNDEDQDEEEVFRQLQSCLDLRPDMEDDELLFSTATDQHHSYRKTLKDLEQHGIKVMGSGSNQMSTEQMDEQHNQSEEENATTMRVHLPQKSLPKVPTIATDSELEYLEEIRRSKKAVLVDEKKARALRRKLYLDLYQEAANKGFI